MAGADLHQSTYTGQFGFVLIESSNNPGRYDQEVFLALRDWEPFFTAEEESEGETWTATREASEARQAPERVRNRLSDVLDQRQIVRRRRADPRAARPARVDAPAQCESPPSTGASRYRATDSTS